MGTCLEGSWHLVVRFTQEIFPGAPVDVYQVAAEGICQVAPGILSV